jgi:hypothetical protein
LRYRENEKRRGNIGDVEPKRKGRNIIKSKSNITINIIKITITTKF